MVPSLASRWVLAVLPLLASATPHSAHKPRAASYPPLDVKGPAPLQPWIDTYNAAKAAGKIPNIAPTVLVNGNPTYPARVDTGPSGVCSWTVSHCFGPNDVFDAPDSHIGIAFDDGPQLASPPLYSFLQAQGQKATHFMIGSRIADNPAIFQQAVTTGGHIAVHTWSHPYMTALTDLQIVGELGWTAQIIYDQAGLVPAFWRPPYGDIDNRVRAIAREVFGLYTVIWNQDTFDWCLTDQGGTTCVGMGPANDAGLDRELQAFYNMGKSPGLIILEHELTTHSVDGFMRNFPTISGKGWIGQAIPDLYSVPWYMQEGVTIGSGPNPAHSYNISSSAPASATVTSTSLSGLVPSSSPLSSSSLPLSSPQSSQTTTTTSESQTVTSTTSSPSATATLRGAASRPVELSAAFFALTAAAVSLVL